MRSRASADWHGVYCNTKHNVVADQGTRVLEARSGDEALARADEYFAWAAAALPDFAVEDWTTRALGLLRSSPFGVPGGPSPGASAPARRKYGALRRSSRARKPPPRIELTFDADRRHPAEFAALLVDAPSPVATPPSSAAAIPRRVSLR